MSGVSDAAFDAVWAKVRRAVRTYAERVTDDPDEVDDFVQEAAIWLWELEPSRFDAADQAEMAYVWRLLTRRMLDVRRETRRMVA